MIPLNTNGKCFSPMLQHGIARIFAPLVTRPTGFGSSQGSSTYGGSKGSSTYGDQTGRGGSSSSSFFFFTASLLQGSNGCLASGLQHCVCPLEPLLLPGFIILGLDTMAGDVYARFYSCRQCW